jgi:uncharacterized protein (TIGR02996 family)
MHDALLRAVTEQPDDDGPRLIYAEWLAEHGDVDRAEFVQLQCAAAALPPGTARWDDLRQREQKLLGQHREAWLQPVRTALGLRPRGWLGWLGGRELDPLLDARFRRGFVEELHLPAGLFLDHAAELVQQTPLRKLTLDFPPSAFVDEAMFARLLDCPQLALLAALEVNVPHLGEDILPRLLGLPAVQGLREFGVTSPELDPGRVVALRGVPLLDRLTRLRLGTPAGLVPNPQEGWALLDRVTRQRYHLRGNGTAAGVEALLSVSEYPALTDLALNNVGLDAAGAALLASSALATRLTGLDLSHNPLGADGLRTLLDGPWPALTRLVLDDTGLGDAGASELAFSPHLRRLERVSLTHNVIFNAGAMALSDSPHLIGRTTVVLADNSVAPRVRQALRVRLGDRVEWGE